MLIPISEASQTGEARRKASAFAEGLAMSSEQCGRVALVATEMATNLVKHAGSGQIILQRLVRNGHAGLRMMAIDKGPGIADVNRALSDGHSTAGSMGNGLGAIQRVPDHFDLYSVPGSGTVISTEFWTERRASPDPKSHLLRVAVISEPLRGEEVCGDGWAAHSSPDGLLFMVVDGLGHGMLAAEAAREAERVLAQAKETALPQILSDVHDALKKTRGAAFAVARIDFSRRTLAYAGVGNICASIVEPPGKARSLASYNGTLGVHVSKFREFIYPWNEESILVMHSDGLTSRWDLAKYPGIWTKQPSMIAALLHRDFSREKDDATVLVAKAT